MQSSAGEPATFSETCRLRFLTAGDLERVLDPDALVDAIARTMAAISERGVSIPPRVTVHAPEVKSSLLMTAAHVRGGSTVTAMLSSRFRSGSPESADRRVALVVVFDARFGVPIALMDGNMLSTMRAAATSRLATRLLADEAADTVAILGSGPMAEAHARAMLRERPDTREVRVVDRNAAMARGLARRLAEDTNAVVVVCTSYEEALAGAGIVCVATASPTPVVRREWITTGSHINSVGFALGGGEIDPELVTDAVVVVEDRETACVPERAGCGDLSFPVPDGVVRATHVRLELGDVVRNTACGRASSDQITLYRSVGGAAGNDAAAALALEVASVRDVGTIVEL